MRLPCLGKDFSERKRVICKSSLRLLTSFGEMRTMRRRDFVKGMLAATAAAKTMAGQEAAAPVAASTAQQTAPLPAPTAVAPAPGPVPWMSGLLEAKPLVITSLVPDTVAESDARFFNEEQTATLRRFAEILMPPLKGYPGALEAGAPEFLDFLIGASPHDRRQMYLAGLDRLDAEARRLFGVPFAHTDKTQADAVIRPWLRAWMSFHPPTEPFAHFINVAHSDIRMATINSQAWSDAAIAAGKHSPGVDWYWYPVDPDMRREMAVPMRRPSVSKARS